MEFYSSKKLLSQKDCRGLTPEIFITQSTRSAGKTTEFSHVLVDDFLKKGSRFGVLYRYDYELEDCADKFFNDIKEIYYPSSEMISVSRLRGKYHELWLDNDLCGYALSINSADTLKKYSHFFNSIDQMFFDEFQSESNNYCYKEIKKFQSLHTSIARAPGKPVRYVRMIMCSNPVSILNPYYASMHINERLRKNTKILRGDGYVLENYHNENILNAQELSGFNRAFAKDEYQTYISQGLYLDDNSSFIKSMSGRSRYLATIKFRGKLFAIREYEESGVIYCDKRADKTNKNKLVLDVNDHDINFVMLKKNDFFIKQLRYFFDRGCFRFKDLECKQTILQLLSY